MHRRHDLLRRFPVHRSRGLPSPSVAVAVAVPVGRRLGENVGSFAAQVAMPPPATQDHWGRFRHPRRALTGFSHFGLSFMAIAFFGSANCRAAMGQRAPREIPAALPPGGSRHTLTGHRLAFYASGTGKPGADFVRSFHQYGSAMPFIAGEQTLPNYRTATAAYRHRYESFLSPDRIATLPNLVGRDAPRPQSRRVHNGVGECFAAIAAISTRRARSGHDRNNILGGEIATGGRDPDLDRASLCIVDGALCRASTGCAVLPVGEAAEMPG